MSQTFTHACMLAQVHGICLMARLLCSPVASRPPLAPVSSTASAVESQVNNSGNELILFFYSLTRLTGWMVSWGRGRGAAAACEGVGGSFSTRISPRKYLILPIPYLHVVCAACLRCLRCSFCFALSPCGHLPCTAEVGWVLQLGYFFPVLLPGPCASAGPSTRVNKRAGACV